METTETQSPREPKRWLLVSGTMVPQPTSLVLQLNSTLTLVDIRVELVNETHANLTAMTNVIADRGGGPNGRIVLLLPHLDRTTSHYSTKNGEQPPLMTRI